MWRNGRAPQRANSPLSPTDRSTAAARLLRQQPQTFQRGNAARSTNRTDTPRRASSRAAVAPAGPAPTTTAAQRRAAAPPGGKGAPTALTAPTVTGNTTAPATPPPPRPTPPRPPPAPPP